MYTNLLVLSLLLYFWCYSNDADLSPQSPAAPHVGAVYVLLHSRPADGLLGHAHPRHSRYFVRLYRGNGHRAVRPVDRLHERHSLLRMAGEALRYAGGDPHHHVLRGVRDDGAERGAVVCLTGAVCAGVDGVWRQLRLGGSGDKCGRGSGRARDEQNRAADDARLL